LTPGLLVTFVAYYCKNDKDLKCDNSNFQALLKCYGGNCCWDKDVCTDNNMHDCKDPNCLHEACLEVNCLPEVRGCLNDTSGCGNAFVAQAEWDYYCQQCMDRGYSASYCTGKNDLGLNCTAFIHSSALLYAQYYCWQPDKTCDAGVTNLLQCLVNGCSTCADAESSNMVTTGLPMTTTTQGSQIKKFDFCDCLFDECWTPFESCFFNQECWDLFFGKKPGYGFDAIFAALVLNNSVIPPVPSVVNGRLNENYCNDKNCNSQFWDVWNCLWDPIFLGATYSCGDQQYWGGETTGCYLGELAYAAFIPECARENCIGYADDCFANSTSTCTTTYTAALEAGDILLCELCDNCQDCMDSEEFEIAYINRCGSSGAECPQEYDNLANCLYQACGQGEGSLPGSKEKVCNTKGSIMQSGILALFLSALLVVISL